MLYSYVIFILLNKNSKLLLTLVIDFFCLRKSTSYRLIDLDQQPSYIRITVINLFIFVIQLFSP